MTRVVTALTVTVLRLPFGILCHFVEGFAIIAPTVYGIETT